MKSILSPRRIYLYLLITAFTQVVFSFHIISNPKTKYPTQRRWQQSASYNKIIFKNTEQQTTNAKTCMSMSVTDNTLHKVPEDDDTPIPFLEVDKSSFIECYADSIAIVNGVEYTIGSPCDHAVALCYFDEDEQLIPIELDEDLMDEIFSLAAGIVEEEFGEELSLERTPQTLTLVGELEEGEEDDEDDEDDEDFIDDEEEDVEILLSFEHEDTEYCLVRLLDPVLLVGKAISEDEQKVKLLTPDESDQVMPILEELFLNAQEEVA